MGTNAAEIEQEIRGAFASVAGEPATTGVTISKEVVEFHNTPAGLRAPHIMGALEHASTFERYSLNGAMVSLVLSPVRIDRPYSMLILLVEVPATDPYVAGAWRIYDLADDSSATHAFALLVEGFGLPVRAGGRTERFIAHETVGPGQWLEVHAPGQELRASCFLKPLADGHSEWAWVFAIDPQRYHAEIARRRA